MIKHSKKKSYNCTVICIAIAIAIVIAIVIYIITYAYKSYTSHFVHFADIAPETAAETAPETTEPDNSINYTTPQTVNAPSMQKPQGCPNSNDTISICNNYESCCNNVPTTECYCKNPAVSICKTQYDQCMSNNDIIGLYTQEQRKQMCTDQRGICCTLYNSLSGTTKQYTATEGVDQKVDQLCLLGLQQDVSIKCPALCSTNKNCAAYSAGNATCKLFSSANPIVPVNVFNKSGINNGITYYKKQ